MSNIALFPNAPTGPRPNGSFVVSLPQLEVRNEPQLYSGVDREAERAINAEVAQFRACIKAASQSCDRLAELLAPYRVETSR